MNTSTCVVCGATFQHSRASRQYCTNDCGSKASYERRRDAGTFVKKATQYGGQCGVCGTEFIGGKNRGKLPRFCSSACAARDQARGMRGPLRIAYERDDHLGVITAIRDKSTLTPSGCWQWTGKHSTGGYPVVYFGRSISVHRMVLEAAHGAPLGSQAAHHKCANTSCVNPDHLEPATHADNVLEMLSRKSYRARIAELETALAAVSPGHPLLAHIGCA